jgi:N-methylhydantoinase B
VTMTAATALGMTGVLPGTPALGTKPSSRNRRMPSGMRGPSLNDSAGSAAVDPVTYQVLVSRLSGIVQEMQENIFRTGYSTIVRESHDASCQILDAAGAVVGEHAVAPLHMTALPGVVAAIKRTFGETIAPGDVFITNHPYLADVTHSVDMAVVAPVFASGELVAFCASIAHKSDLGGMVPGTANATAKEAFQEGLLLPPVRFMRGGEIVRDVEAILRANSRTPDLIFGDIRGQVGVAHLGERRLHEAIARYGLETLKATFAARLDHTERQARAAIRALPDGVVEAERQIDGDTSSGVRYHVRIEKRGDALAFDFTGSSDQVPMPINVRPSIVRGCIYFILLGLLGPEMGNNGGLARVVSVTTRPGSILDPIFPGPTNAYMNTAMAICEVVLAALSRLTPERRVADGGGVGGGLALSGKRKDGSHFSTYELIGSAFGARSGKDGISGISALLTNSRTAPIEIMESEFPLRFTRWELRCDSGGPGTFRGGLGPVREYELLADRADVTLRGGKHRFPALGIDGGADGQLGDCTINPGTAAERAMPSRFNGLALNERDILRLAKSGGAGIGAPQERAFRAVVDDVIDGYVSRESALRDYAVDGARLDAAVAERT